MEGTPSTRVNPTWLVSPATKTALHRKGESLVSEKGEQFRINDRGVIDFLGDSYRGTPEEGRAFFDRLKAMAKKHIGRFYPFLVYLISPVMPRIHWSSLSTYWSHTVDRVASGKDLVIQVGSGNDRVHEGVINIDIFNFPEVDLIADATNLPFANESVDVVVSLAVLEHVPDPDAFLREAQRVLKPSGQIVTGVPFIQGFHPSPGDFYRWTDQGLSFLHERHGFARDSVVPFCGPTSAFLWIFQEWIALLFSFGIRPLYVILHLMVMLLTAPLKLLDVLLVHHPVSRHINSFNIYVGQKV